MKLTTFVLNRHTPKVGIFEKEVTEFLRTAKSIVDLEVHEDPHNSTVIFVFKENDAVAEAHEIVLIGPDKLETVVSNTNATIVRAEEENKQAKFARLVVLTKTGRTISVVLFKDKQLDEAKEAEATAKENKAEAPSEEAKTQGNSPSPKRGRKKQAVPAN